MQIMGLTKKYLFPTLLLLLITGLGPASAQFIRTHIHIPAGVQISKSGNAERLYPQAAARGSESAGQYLWLELRAMDNLQLQAELRDGEDRILSIEELLLLNDGSDNFAIAANMSLGAFVMRGNPLLASRRNREMRAFGAWLGIPLSRSRHIVIHYP
jgi:hypothetical protein